jgi:hypothetical protein
MMKEMGNLKKSKLKVLKWAVSKMGHRPGDMTKATIKEKIGVEGSGIYL